MKNNSTSPVNNGKGNINSLKDTFRPEKTLKGHAEATGEVTPKPDEGKLIDRPLGGAEEAVMVLKELGIYDSLKHAVKRELGEKPAPKERKTRFERNILAVSAATPRIAGLITLLFFLVCLTKIVWAFLL